MQLNADFLKNRGESVEKVPCEGEKSGRSRRNFAKIVDKRLFFGYNKDVSGQMGVRPELCGCNSMVECQLPKLITWVRFPSPAPRSLATRLFP